MGYSTVRRIMREGLTDPRNIDGIALWNSTQEVTDMTTDTGIKLWADKSGNSSVNVLCLNGVAGNYASAPDSSALTIANDIEFIVNLTLSTNTPASFQPIAGKRAITNNAGYSIELTTGGLIGFRASQGSTLNLIANSSAIPYAALTRWYLKVNRVAATGLVSFFSSLDGTAWSAMGTASTTSGAIATSADGLGIGRFQNSDANFGGGYITGIIYSVAIASTINDTPVFNADFTRQSKLTTSFIESSSNAATVTINTSGATGARISGARDYAQMTGSLQGTLANGYLTMDGTDDYMTTPAFPLPTVHTRVMAMRQTTWSSGDYLCDGRTANTSAIIQTTSTPQINISAGSSVAANTALPVNTNAVVTAVINGASSLLRIGLGVPTTGNAGSGVPNGQTLGASGTPGNYGNAGFAELLTFNRALDECDQSKAIRVASIRARVSTV